MLELHNHAKSLGVLFSPRRHEQREATLSSQCMVYCQGWKWSADKQKIFYRRFDVTLFGKISWRKKWLSSVKLKTKSEELECVIFILSFNLWHHSFYTGYTTICKDLHFKWKKKNPTLPVHHIYILLDLQYMIVADIILSPVMIKPDYAVWEE